MDNYSGILTAAYEKFILPISGKKVPTPYRINLPFQPDPRKKGKSDAETLLQDTIQIAKEKNFDLDKATVEEIQQFMREDMLGIDCSGLIYHLLDHLLKTIGKGGMKEIGFPEASKTNVELLTSSTFCERVKDFQGAKTADLIRVGSQSLDGMQHCLIILDGSGVSINYAHSSRKTQIQGVHKDHFLRSKYPNELKVYTYNPADSKDGVWRLKALA